MPDDQKPIPPLTDAEILKFRELVETVGHREWMWRTFLRISQWIVGVVAAVYIIRDWLVYVVRHIGIAP